MEFLNFIRDHFMHAAPILAVGLIAVAIVLERAMALFISLPMRDLDGFFDTINALVMTARFNEAKELCDRHGAKPVAQVVKAALARAGLPPALAQDGVQLTIQKCTDRLTKRTGFLTTAANVATLLGLLGTIAGLIQSFDAVGHADPQQKSALLSAGISTAMNATVLGLCVAIPCMVAFSLLVSRTNQMVSECEQSAIRILEIMKQRFYAEDHGAQAHGATTRSAA